MKTNKTNPSSKNSTKVAKNSTKVAKVAKDDVIAKDRFGSRKSSQAAKINAVLSTQPAYVSDVAEKTGFEPGRVRSHLESLVAKKLIVKTSDGSYKVKAKASK